MFAEIMEVDAAGKGWLLAHLRKIAKAAFAFGLKRPQQFHQAVTASQRGWINEKE